MKKKNGIYLILGIVVLISIGVSIYYFNNLSDSDKYIDTINLDDDEQFDSNESYDNDRVDNTSSDGNILESNNSNDNDINNTNQNNIENYENKDNSDNDIDNDKNYFNELSVNDVGNLIDNKSNFILVISQTWCSHCTSYKPKVEDVANNNKVSVYYIEYNMLSEDDKNIFNGYVDFSGTPTTVFFKDGVELKDIRILGDTSGENLESVFRNNGYIK